MAKKLDGTKLVIIQKINIYNNSILKLAQQSEFQNIKSITGVNVQLFGEVSWNYINKLVNVVNSNLFHLSSGLKVAGGQSLNFQVAVKNPTLSSKFTGSLKNLFLIAEDIWKIVTSQNNKAPYSIDQAVAIAKELMGKINSLSFPEPTAKNIKSDLISILTEWLVILK